MRLESGEAEAGAVKKGFVNTDTINIINSTSILVSILVSIYIVSI